jgi:hypothetical protein
MKRFGSATRNGDLREGKGSVSTESRALESHPYREAGRTSGFRPLRAPNPTSMKRCLPISICDLRKPPHWKTAP